jgi:hypothetical protein
MNWSDFHSGLVGAVISILLTALVTSIADRRHYDRRKIYSSNWISTWQISPDIKPDWAIERVEIKHNWRSTGKFRGRLALKCFENSHKCEWTGYADVIGNRDIIGEWRSTKPGSHASGVFAFTISPRGDFMYGYGIGEGESAGNKIIVGAWVLARRQQDIQRAKDSLWENRRRFRRS